MSDIEKKEELKEELEEIGKEKLRVTKRNCVKEDKDSEYSEVYKVTFPVTFYFDREGIYDGLAVDTEDITEDEEKILEELLDRLANAEDMNITDEFNDE